MNDLELLRFLLVNSKNIRDENTYRAHSYGIIMTFLLSREIFNTNIDIQPFLEDNNISFKEYIYQSRTQIVGRVCREIESFNIEQLRKINNSINKIVFSVFESDSKNGTRVKKSDNEENYFDSLLNHFERRKS